MATLSLQSIEVQLGGVEILRGLDLVVESGTSLAVLGPSGSGKTTLLHTIVGLQRPSAGRVIVGNADITHAPTHLRGIALVTQDPALQPNLTLSDNVELPLMFAEEHPKERRRRRAFLELRRFGIGRLGNRRADQTSAGEQQTASTARETVRQTSVLLLDEPVIALDPIARRTMIRQIRSQQRSAGTTMLVATNDWEVAAGLADRMAVLTDGVIGQTGTPLELFDHPSTLDVGGLTGRWKINRLSGRVRHVDGERNEIVTAAGPLRTWRELPERAMIVGIRPEDLEVVGSGSETGSRSEPGAGSRAASESDAANASLSAVVESAAVLGRTSLVSLDADGIPLQAMGPTPSPAVGTTVRLAWRRAHLFDLDGNAFDHLD